MDNKTLWFSSILIALFIIFCVPFVTSQEVDDEHEFTYDVNSPNGPRHWGEIHSEWSMCNQGDLQSPVDLLHKRVETTSSLGRLDRDYKPANSTIVNRGHDMMLRWIGGAGHLHINGTEFNLELHLVHQSTDGKIAVVGIMYKIGRPDSLLSLMEPYFKALASTKDVEKNVGIIDPRQIKVGSRKYYRYIGSLTTPPCTQNVIWTIVNKVRTVSREQLHAIREAVHDHVEVNSRPVQPLNNRWLKLYRPDTLEKEDILEFGTVLLEILSGEVKIGSTLLRESIGFLGGEGSEGGCFENLKSFMDPCLKEDYPLAEALCLGVLAKACVENDPLHRPSMDDILKVLARMV
nr:alpha carbonic anhydrase 7-like [Tanacetum cinerariifolium]